MKRYIFCVGALVALAGCSAAVDAGDEKAESIGAESSALLYDPMYAFHYDFNDNPTQCVYENLSMHCCPSGWAMDGTQIPGNMFRCSKLTSNAGARFLDKYTQRMGMHACPVGSVMVGLHEDANWLICQWISGKTVREDLDVGTPGAFHGCHLAGMDGGLMSGIRIDQAKYICAADANMNTGGSGGSTGGGVTSSTVTATITVDIGANPPQQGCGTTTFLLDGTPMTFMGGQLLLDSIYHCRYTASQSGVSLAQHRITVSDFNSCQKFTPSSATTSVLLSPFTCVP